MEQIVQVPLQFFGRAADAGGAHDQAHAFGNVECGHGFAHFGAVIAFDAPRNATGARIVGHQHQKAAGQADEGGQGGALVAALLLVHLDYDFLTFGNHVLDIDAAAVAGCFGLEVAAGDFLQRQKAVPFGTVIHERGFQAGFDPGDLAFVDVGFLLFPRRVFRYPDRTTVGRPPWPLATLPVELR